MRSLRLTTGQEVPDDRDGEPPEDEVAEANDTGQEVPDDREGEPPEDEVADDGGPEVPKKHYGEPPKNEVADLGASPEVPIKPPAASLEVTKKVGDELDGVVEKKGPERDNDEEVPVDQDGVPDEEDPEQDPFLSWETGSRKSFSFRGIQGLEVPNEEESEPPENEVAEADPAGRDVPIEEESEPPENEVAEVDAADQEVPSVEKAANYSHEVTMLGELVTPMLADQQINLSFNKLVFGKLEKAKLGRIRLPEEELKEAPESVLTNIWRSVDISFNAGLPWDPGEKIINPFMNVMNVYLLSGEHNLAAVYLATPKMSQFNMAAEYLATPNMSQVPRKYQKGIKRHSLSYNQILKRKDADKPSNRSVVHIMDPFMTKVRLAFYMPKEVD